MTEVDFIIWLMIGSGAFSLVFLIWAFFSGARLAGVYMPPSAEEAARRVSGRQASNVDLE